MNSQGNKKPSIFVIFVCFFILVFTVNIIYISSGLHSLYDFGLFIAAGRLANNGDNPYSFDSKLISSVMGEIIEGDAPNINPPISVLIFQLVANVNPYLSITFWRISSILLYISALAIFFRLYPVNPSQVAWRVAWAFCLAGLWTTIRLGQLYAFLVLLTVASWVLLKQNKPIAAGMVLGILIALKPSFVMWAILLFFTGNWRFFLSAALAAATISGIPILTNGVEIYRQWLDAVSVYTPNLLIFHASNSFQGLTARLGSARAGIILSILYSAFIIIYVWRTKPAIEKVNGLGIVSSLFISPIAWTGYTLFTFPIFFAQKKLDWKLIVSAVIFAIPFGLISILFTQNHFTYILFGWFYGWGLLFLLSGILLTPAKRADSLVSMTPDESSNSSS